VLSTTLVPSSYHSSDPASLGEQWCLKYDPKDNEELFKKNAPSINNETVNHPQIRPQLLEIITQVLDLLDDEEEGEDSLEKNDSSLRL
jgi:hypothetical protein